ncbi:MAG TPA: hypothetical protein VKG01_03640 [Thermoanaerobaculia bacterium]|nr:hypothetical protein [Thermoanaerobaculia bacterium]
MGLVPTLEISPLAPVGSELLANRPSSSIASQWYSRRDRWVTPPWVSILHNPEPVSRK